MARRPTRKRGIVGPAKRPRVFTLLGYTMSNVDDERRFLSILSRQLRRAMWR